jgi:hypothetical protein
MQGDYCALLGVPWARCCCRLLQNFHILGEWGLAHGIVGSMLGMKGERRSCMTLSQIYKGGLTVVCNALAGGCSAEGSCTAEKEREPSQERSSTEGKQVFLCYLLHPYLSTHLPISVAHIPSFLEGGKATASACVHKFILRTKSDITRS